MVKICMLLGVNLLAVQKQLYLGMSFFLISFLEVVFLMSFLSFWSFQ